LLIKVVLNICIS